MEKSPAQVVIEKFGGAAAVAKAIGCNLSWVYRWTYTVEKGGTGGVIPAKFQAPLLKAARESGVDLKPADFFPAEAA